MENIFKRLGKTGSIVATLLTIVGGILAIIPAYQAFTQKDVNGTWKITCHINESSLKRYIGKSSGFKVFFIQDGEKIKGEGEMFWIDDQEIPYTQHARIIMEGMVEDEYVKIAYTQFGEKRTTSGSMKLRITSDNEMTGTFEGTAANSKGVVNAKMLN